MNITEGTKLVDLRDRGENPAEYPYDCRLEIDPDEHQAIIVWTEDLAFHAELAQSDEERFSDLAQQNWHKWSDLTVDGWLTVESEDKLGVELERLIAKDGVKVWRSESGGDEPSVTFEVVTDYTDDETYDAWFDRIGWPVIATLINATDPGTFMFPYLFSAILYH